MDGVSAAASILALVELAAKVTTLCVKYSTAVAHARDSIARLRDQVQKLEAILRRAHSLIDQNGQSLQASCELKTLPECNAELEWLRTKLDPGLARKTMRHFGVRAFTWPFREEEVQSIISRIGRYQSDISFGLQLDQTAILLTLEQRAVLDRLPIAQGAYFNSYAEEHNPTCLPNTRVEVLEDIWKWVHKPDAKAIFWLNGMAGTGKSTLSRTIALSLSSEASLGASFFFKRGEADRGDLSKFITTIARQLSDREPKIALAIKDAIEADPTIPQSGVRAQFTQLISKPLSGMAHITRPVIIVVDALDECDNDADIKLLIQLFSSVQQLPCGLRIFVTSRPELPIRLDFSNIQGSYQDLILHEIASQDIKRDISLFLKHSFRQICDDYNNTVTAERRLPDHWPGEQSINSLADMSSPLFIFAATACRYISDRKCGSPNTLLHEFLQSQGSNSQLDATYLPILQRQLANIPPQKEEIITQQFRSIVGTIVLLASPLSIPALAQILNVSQDIIETRVDLLHSVFDVPSSPTYPVRPYHLSFRDYLVDPERYKTTPLWIDEEKTHRATAEHCLRIMRERLRPDICGVKAPGLLRSAIDQQTIDTCLPSELQYSCLYWVYHIQRTAVCSEDGEQIYNFLTSQLLHWLEALSLMGQTVQILRLIRTLQRVFESSRSAELLDLLDDTARFVLAHSSAIDSTPLQIYSSLLAFLPKKSIMRAHFGSRIPRWISLETELEATWGACLRILEGHRDAVNSVAFSHDSTLIVSASFDCTVRLWSTDTGECVQTLEGHSTIVLSVAFSHDSALIISGSSDGIIRLWRTDTGECVQILECRHSLVWSVAFSHDSALIASGSDDGTIRLWRTDTGECVQILEGYISPVRSVAFSHDSTLIVSGSEDRTIRLWSTNTGECVQVLVGHDDAIRSVVFSHDSGLLASASEDKTVRLWYPYTGECIRVLKGHEHQVKSIAFSYDSVLLASASADETIRIWRPNTGEHVRTLKGHNEAVQSLAFSHDSALLASASQDSTVRLWRPDTSENVQTVEAHNDRVQLLAFSHDSRLLASASHDSTVRLWYPDTGECAQILEGHSDLVRCVVFSHDLLLASASLDRTIRLWRPETGECMQILEGHKGPVQSAAFSHDSALIASGSFDSTIRLWRTNTGECVQILEGHSSQIPSLVFSKDSVLLASGSFDNSVRLWHVGTGECVRVLKDYGATFPCVALSHDSALLASGSSNSTVKLWRTGTGEHVQTLDIGTYSLHLRFQNLDREILTDIGAFAIRGTNPMSFVDHSAPSSSSYRSGYGISVDECWITQNVENILWLPRDYRPTCSAVSGRTIAIGCASGKVLFITMPLDGVDRSCQVVQD